MSRVLKILLVMVLATLSLVGSDVIATVNDKDITREDVDQFVAKSIRGARYSAMNTTQKQQVVNQLIDRALYVEVARKEGIEQDAEYSKALLKVKENLMLDIWMKKRLNDIKVSDQEVHTYYQQHDRKFMKTASASVRHILVSS
ncbi:MAG TPA: peptidylprolyl isomerase, partial [Campylobacterales bacterium]|nr:peptidylprolyl isomerase [Campylobacterales bacterium]